MITAEVQQVPPPLPVDHTYDAEATSQPLVPSRNTSHHQETTYVYNGSNDKVPEQSRSQRTFFYVAFVLLAMAASGVGVWCVMDSSVLSSAGSEQTDVQSKPSGDATSSLPPVPSPLPFPQLMISEARPLDNCMGDCDDDSDCAPGLMCFQRNHHTPVPGCLGGLADSSNADYCIPIELPSLVETTTFPLGLCEGDCDSNHDCQNGLICYQRSEFEHVPGCSGGTDDGSRTDYCVPRSLVPETYLISLQQKLIGNPDDNFGSSVSLSQSEPLLMAVGAVDRGSTGYVNIYQLSGEDDWILVATIPGDAIGSDFGYSVSLSWDGKYVAVGMPRSEVSFERSTGAVRVFELTELSTTDIRQSKFQQVGEDVRENDWEYGGFGYSVSLNRDGRTLAVAQQASLSIFERSDSGNWSPLGPTLEIGSFGGGSVTLSGDGSRLAVNSRSYDGPNDGYGRVYKFNENEWVPVGKTLGDVAISDSFGLSNILMSSSSLSGDGTIVVMSCRVSGNSDVRVYQEIGGGNWIPIGDPILSPVDDYAPASKVEITKDGGMVAIGDFEMGRVRLYEFETRTGRWVLVNEIYSEHEDDQFGVTLSLSVRKGGAYLAIGGPNKKHILGNPGYAVTYKTAFGIRPDPTSAPAKPPTNGAGSNSDLFLTVSSWNGEEEDFKVGKSVAVSEKLFAYGAFSENAMSKVLIYAGNQESELLGSETGDEFGYSIALSQDGLRIAVGIPNSRVGSEEGAGRVQVYEYDENFASWTQLGSDLMGSGRFGHSVSLSYDGQIVAVGAPYSNESGVSIFRFENNEWVKMGDDITVASHLAAYHGWSVSLSENGLVVAIGGPTNEDNWDEAGACRIYEYVNNSWEQRGEPILGQQRHGLLGTSVSLSDDGNTVAIGAINYDLPESYINEEEGVYHHGEKAGAVLVYQLSGDDWRPLGKPIFGDEAFDRFGTSVSLTRHENRLFLAAGAPEHGGGGRVRLFVFDEEDSYWNQIQEVQQYDPSHDSGKNAGFGTTVALASGTDSMKMAVGAPRARSGYGERLGLLPKYDGEVTLWQE